MVDVRSGPTLTSSAIALGAGCVASLSMVPLLGLELLCSLAGLAIVGGGLLTGQRGAITIGALLQLSGVLLAAAAGLVTAQVLVGAVSTVVAWDCGHHAVVLGEQVGRAGPSRRAELVHAGTTTAIVATPAAAAYSLYSVVTGGQPVTALVALLLAAVLLVVALRE